MRPKVVASLLTKEQDFQSMQAMDAERAAARADLDLEIVYANNNGALQIVQLQRLIHAPVAARPVAIIAHTVAGEGLANVARDAAKAGIGWIILSRDVPYIDSLRAEYPLLPIAIVSTDQRAVGRIQGQQFQRLLASGGNVLYVQGPPDTSAAQQRLAAVEKTIAGSSINLKVLTARWTESSAEEAVVSWLRMSNSETYPVHLIGAQNDAMAVGARNAIGTRRPEWLRLPFTGCDGLPEGGQRLVNEGKLAATIIVQSNTGPAIELIATHLRTGASVPARLILQPRAYPATL